jgi:uncharacterized HAD superfamily protein/adenine/guanine phosphoribosyltransferase-like PRPP-binding protein
MKIQYRGYEDLIALIRSNFNSLHGKFDLVVGVPNSGLVPGLILAQLLNLPFLDYPSFIQGREVHRGMRKINYTSTPNNQNVKVLIVDDSIRFGRQIRLIQSDLERLSKSIYEFKYLVIFGDTKSNNFVDFVFETIDKLRVFEWNILNCWILEQACVDIDGVLCEDPSHEQNDDGPKYLHFLLNARPKIIPKYKINTLVTARLEKYRAETEIWLQKNNVKYERLIMLDLPNAEIRRKLNIHSKYKAEVYEKSDTVLFIESSLTQAKLINARSNRSVFSVENSHWFSEQPRKKNKIDIIRTLLSK